MVVSTLISGHALAAEKHTAEQTVKQDGQETIKQNNDKTVVEVAFVLDTTGSMSSLIDGAKKKIWSIANSIVDINPNTKIRMALIAYRDREDDYIVRKVHQLDTDVQELYSSLLKLDAKGGGDTPESVNEALDKGVNSLQWGTTNNTKRILFLVGDAPPHMDYLDEKQYPAIIKEAVTKGIIVNTVQAGSSRQTAKAWKKIAQLGKGTYLTIPQDGGQIAQIKTPYDDDILKVQAELDKTVITYGDQVTQKKIVEKMAVRKAAPKATQVENSVYYAKKKSEKKVVSGKGDLVADVYNEKVSLDSVEQSSLPSELKDKSKEELKAILKKS